MIFVTGPHCVGKTYFARLLQRKGFSYIDLGPTIRNIWRSITPDLTLEEFIIRGEEKFGVHFVDSLLVAELVSKLDSINKERLDRDLLVVGSRSITGINYIKSRVISAGQRSIIFYIDALKEVLYERYCRRENPESSREEFERILEKDIKIGLVGIKEIADYIIDNSGTQKEFEDKIQELVQTVYPNEVFRFNRAKEKGL